MENIEVLNMKCKTYDGVLPGITGCLVYKQGDEVNYLVNAAILDDVIKYDYYITKDYSLYYLLSCDIDELADYDLTLLSRLQKEARKPETSEEWLLAYDTDYMIERKFRELHYLDDDEDEHGDEYLCE